MIEVYIPSIGHGDIGLATSTDGFHWNYEQIVLSEGWHHSYPLVLKYNGTYYMIPGSYVQNEVCVYEATNFPYNWSRVSPILTGIAEDFPRYLSIYVFLMVAIVLVIKKIINVLDI